MKYVVLLASVMALSLPACAQDAVQTDAVVITESVTAAKTISLFGKTFDTPKQIDQPMTWDQVSTHVPADLSIAPDKEVTNLEILEKVSALLQQAVTEYESGLSALVPDRMKNHPEEDEETAKLMMGDRFIIGNGANISQDVQNAAYKYMALSYIKDTVEAEIMKSVPSAVEENKDTPAPAPQP